MPDRLRVWWREKPIFHINPKPYTDQDKASICPICGFLNFNHGGFPHRKVSNGWVVISKDNIPVLIPGDVPSVWGIFANMGISANKVRQDLGDLKDEEKE